MKASLTSANEKHKDLPVTFYVVLKHSWNRTLLESGDIVRIIGTFTKENNFTLILDDIPVESDQQKSERARFLVLEPEILIPSTSISTASPCPRVPLFRELFKNAEGDPNYALILGNVVHLVFQKILENITGKFEFPTGRSELSYVDLYVDKNETKMEQAIKESMQDQLVSLYLIKDEHPEEKVVEDIKQGKV